MIAERTAACGQLPVALAAEVAPAWERAAEYLQLVSRQEEEAQSLTGSLRPGSARLGSARLAAARKPEQWLVS